MEFLKTTQEEDEIIIIDDGGKEEANKNLVLVGKIITRKQIKMESVGKFMQEIWKPEGLMTTVEKPDNTIIFKFSNPIDRKRILNDSPWHFNKHLMVLQEVVEENPLCDINLHECEFWVQIWNVPSTYLTQNTAENLSIGLGRITKIDVDSEGNVKEEFIRLRVGINVDKPLKRIIKAVLGGKEVTLNLKYEKLPDFCYGCGKMDHLLSECETSLQYGPWLRAQNCRREVIEGNADEKDVDLHMRGMQRQEDEKMLVSKFDSVEGPQQIEGSSKLVESQADNGNAVGSQSSIRISWKIESFSKLHTKKHYSEVFSVGGFNWRILMYPKGNTVDSLSIYLDVADSPALPHGWRKYAKFSLAVVDQVHNKYTITKESEHHFNDDESDWGFTKFMLLSEIYNSARGYLVNDTCIVEAEVDVREIVDEH